MSNRNYVEAIQNKQYDFAGWATRNDVRCSDGVIIRHGAFSEDHGKIVPFVIEHQRKDPAMLAGEAVLEERNDGMWCYVFLDDTKQIAQHAKVMVEHGELDSFSIYAHATKQGPNVVEGEIGEVSLVSVGKNPGAMIDYTTVSHGEGDKEEFEAIMQYGFEIQHGLVDDPNFGLMDKIKKVNFETGFAQNEEEIDPDFEGLFEHGAKDETILDILKTLTEKQLLVVADLIERAAASGTSTLEQGESDEMKKNAFNQAQTLESKTQTAIEAVMIQHGEGLAILEKAKNSPSGSIKDAAMLTLNEKVRATGYNGTVDSYMIEHGIENIGLLFPEYHQVNSQILEIKDMHTAAARIMNGTKKFPHANLKSLMANLTGEELRAGGYITGDEKPDHTIELLQRTIHPATIVSKQSIDRDLVIDITDYNIIQFFQKEMREALINMIARCMLTGDGKPATDRTHVAETKIIPILKDDPLFAMPYTTENTITMIDDWILNSSDLLIEGDPVLIINKKAFATLRTYKDGFGHYMFQNDEAIKNKLGVSDIIESSVCPVDKAIFLKLDAYGFGSNKGGEITWFDEFKIDFNLYTYLVETRLSGGLLQPKACAVFTLTKPLTTLANQAIATPITNFSGSITDGKTGVYPATLPASGKWGLNGAEVELEAVTPDVTADVD